MIIDMHAHIAPEHFPIKTGTPSAGLWPSMEHLASGDVDMYIGDKMLRKFADTVWDSVTRSDALPGIGVDKQVLSPLPQLLMYHIDPVEGAELASYLNETIARMVTERPDHYYGLGSVPL